MSPSGLIFLVVIAIWAAYFLQHWVRRREQLAIARSVDSFSETMRVLERRAAPAPDLTEPHPRSYAVTPARPAQPQVLVKRAGSSASSGVAVDADLLEDAPVLRGPAPLATGRRMRGLAFLASVATLVASVPLAGFGVLPWLAVAAPVLALAGVLVWMRHGARTEQAARREAARRQRAQRAEVAAEARSARPAARPAPSRAADPVPVAADEADHLDDAYGAEPAEEAPAAQPGSHDLYDLQAVEEAARSRSAEQPHRPAAAAVVPVGPLVDEDDIPLTWDPVPVPRPTYTMKAVAQRHAPAPVEQGVPPELADAAYDEPVWKVAGA
ncbi:MAG TPA: hypothetical protein VH915_12930 [Pedococcus sp.]